MNTDKNAGIGIQPSILVDRLETPGEKQRRHRGKA
jgi:hypothetical protein